jgi:hypothetical protein
VCVKALPTDVGHESVLCSSIIVIYRNFSELCGEGEGEVREVICRNNYICTR